MTNETVKGDKCLTRGIKKVKMCENKCARSELNTRWFDALHKH
jgi:hypothetical protein